MKRIVCLLLVAIMCLSFVACGDDVEVTKPVVDVTEDLDDGAEKPDIPLTYDYDGYEFNFLSCGNVQYLELSYDEESSISLDNAQYKRKAKVQNDYNITITEESEFSYSSGGGPGFKRISNQVNSGDYTYDLALIAGYDVSVLAYSGYLYDLASVPTINLSKSWWDQNATDSLSVKGVTFFTTGDLTVSDNLCAYAIMFNKRLLNDYNLDSPYDLVYNGEWTFEAFSKMAKSVGEDVNQDGTFGAEDLYGLLVWDDSIVGVVNAAGQRCCTIVDDVIELTFYNESTLSALEQYAEIAYDNQHSLCWQRLPDTSVVKEIWASDRALFNSSRVESIIGYREMESDFGVLPYPKLNVQQDDHYSTVAAYNTPYVCIPLMQEDIERTGTITEALAYHGQKIVLPALYDVTLIGQGTRDEDSEGMLDIIFGNLVYDIGYIYQIGPYNKQLIYRLRDYDANFTSMYDTYQPSAKAMLKLINKAYEDAVS
ncbi:MAG: extracellular solute-binding protein, partial [Clostridia bacterium]|nr:extracellular solute-binding protein [Clostridia bacterium]